MCEHGCCSFSHRSSFKVSVRIAAHRTAEYARRTRAKHHPLGSFRRSTRTFSRPSSTVPRATARRDPPTPKSDRTSHIASAKATNTAAHPKNVARSSTPSASINSATGIASKNVPAPTSARSSGPAAARARHGGFMRNRVAASRPIPYTRKPPGKLPRGPPSPESGAPFEPCVMRATSPACVERLDLVSRRQSCAAPRGSLARRPNSNL